MARCYRSPMLLFLRKSSVRSVSLDVADNEIVTIIGANGAGKTTLLNAIMGVLPLKGGAAFAGDDMAPLDIEDRVAAGLCLVPEHRELFGTMNVEDNLELGAFRIPKATAVKSFEKVYTLFPRLKERRKQLAGTLSGGEQQMLAMGRALMGAPKLLMLDEPSLGLAPIIVADIFRTIGELRAAGVSVLLVEQNAQAALKIADRAYVMELGEFILSGPATISPNQRVRRLSRLPAEGASEIRSACLFIKEILSRYEFRRSGVSCKNPETRGSLTLAIMRPLCAQSGSTVGGPQGQTMRARCPTGDTTEFSWRRSIRPVRLRHLAVTCMSHFNVRRTRSGASPARQFWP